MDTDVIRPLERDNAFRQQQELRPEDFVVLYSGNLGVKQGLETLVEAADLLRGDPRIVFFIVGEGMRKADLEADVARRRLNNVRFLPPQPMDAFSQVLSAADVLVLIQKGDIVDIVMPSKLLTYMAAGRPVVAAVNPKSEAGRYVRKADCGLVVPPEDPEALAKAIRSLSADPQSVTRLGVNARAFAEQHFSKTVVLRKYEELFRRICVQSTGES